ncbi:phosphoribosyltransferase [Microlunatus elymi]|uniref:Phosphoribosyltransferase n=2 Tax=Microlunatus elymi TaxID=2596828 RepID=A0A516Q682_9ACTN|nr:phosphoribosyltransferase [Microlunatus elymi]
MRFRDRAEAGDQLADQVAALLTGAGPDRELPRRLQVLALPRGGVPVARPIADRLDRPLRLLLVRKLGLPGHPELAMGAIAALGGRIEIVHNDAVLHQHRVDPDEWAAVLEAETAELRRRVDEFGAWTGADPAGAAVVLVDDGLATGATMRAAVAVTRAVGAGRIVVAVPVASTSAVAQLQQPGVSVLALSRPDPLIAVGEAYRDFHQLDDSEVIALLQRR